MLTFRFNDSNGSQTGSVNKDNHLPFGLRNSLSPYFTGSFGLSLDHLTSQLTSLLRPIQESVVNKCQKIGLGHSFGICFDFLKLYPT